MIAIGKRKLLAKSCKRCGGLKQAREFSRVSRVYFNSYCNLCKNALSSPGVRAHQQAAHNAAVLHGQPWTNQDIKSLAEMAQRGLSGAQMAHALNRTVYSVYTMKNKLNKEF